MLYISAIDEVSADLFAVNDSLALLIMNGERLVSALDGVRTDIDNAKSSPSCVSCDILDTNSLRMDADFDSVSSRIMYNAH